MPEAYNGDRNFIFVSYAHADGDVALPMIASLADEGYRVWYDDGIEAGSPFPAFIADRVHDCSCLLMLVSSSSLFSDWCRNEVRYALELGRSILPIYLEDVELPRELEMRLGTVQALHWYAFDTDEEFYKKLFGVPMLRPCLKPEGARRRGVKPRSMR